MELRIVYYSKFSKLAFKILALNGSEHRPQAPVLEMQLSKPYSGQKKASFDYSKCFYLFIVDTLVSVNVLFFLLFLHCELYLPVCVFESLDKEKCVFEYGLNLHLPL